MNSDHLPSIQWQIVLVSFIAAAVLSASANVQADDYKGDIIYVDCNASGRSTGTDWPNAFRFLQDGLAAATAGAMIFVAECTYYPDRDTAHPKGTGSRAASFELINEVQIYGGFSPAHGVDTFRERNWDKFKAVLSGNIGTTDSSDDNSYHVIRNPKGINSTAILDGFFIIRGNADGAGSHASGGGMYNENASPLVRNCVFTLNNALDQGGGIYNLYSEAVFRNCTFDKNTVPSGRPGGGVYSFDSDTEFDNCTFSSNRAGSGAALYNYRSSPILVACTFSNNESGYAGGAVYNYNSSSPEFYNCLFHHNSASLGGGLHNSWASSSLIVNCTFRYNAADSSGGAIYNRSGCSATINNSILYDDSPQEIYPGFYTDADYSDIQGNSPFPGTGNINQSPLMNTSFHLQPGSPCIDSGDNDAVPAWLNEDFEGDPRIVNGDQDDPEAAVDMGADEAPFVTVTWDLAVNSTTGGSVSLPGEGVFSFDHGSVVDLLAVAWNDYRFRSWTGDIGGIADADSAHTEITMTGNASITANFEPDIDPDLIVTDVWSQNDRICFQIRNIGDAAAEPVHYTRLYVDGEPVVSQPVEFDIMPGERKSLCFEQYPWMCGGEFDDIRVCADVHGDVREIDETNNCRTETWQCDRTPPVITSPPEVSAIGRDSAVISWDTDTDSGGLVLFSATAGVYDQQAQEAQPSQTHSIALDNLQPSTTYQYKVRSTDSAGNTVESGPFFFRTAPLSDSIPPQISNLEIRKGQGNILYYMMRAEVSDNTGVEKVEFYLDDELVCTDYSPPFECQIAPMYMEMDEDAFFREHTVSVVAVDHALMRARSDMLFDPPYECAEVQSEMISPFPSEVYYIPGSLVEPGTTIAIRVNAYRSDMNCAFVYMPGLPPGASSLFCSEEQNPVSEVRFFVNRVLVDTQSAPVPGTDHVYEAEWSIGGYRPGVYNIRVDAVDSEECIQTVTNTFTIEVGEPELEVTREVTRHGSYFQVDLLFRNRGTLDVVFDKATDFVKGFQPMGSADDENYDIIPHCSTDGKECEVEIDFTGNYFHLNAHSSILVRYYAVPVMYPPGEVVEYGMGVTPVRVEDFWGLDIQEFDRPCILSTDDRTLPEEVQRARNGSDYLVVTNPDRLFSSFFDAEGVDRLLSAMAELARYRNAVLGYVFGTDSDDTGWIKDCIAAWGATMRGTDGVSDSYLSNGYLLLVGETEIIPSFTKTVKRKFWGITITSRTVHWTDMPYGDTNGHIDPELSVARIIGDDPAELLAPIEASINVIKGEAGFEYDRSHALVVSGRGDGVTSFEGNVDDVSAILDDEFAVTVRKRRVVEDAGGNITAEFKLNDANMDHLFYRDHCNPGAWSGVINTGDFTGADPVDFEDAKPFAFACCCQAGQYEDDSEDSADSDNIAEAFLQHGAASYIGSTENSFRGQNNSSAKWFYNHWVNSSDPVGETFRALKVHLGGFQGDYWSYEYNLYGDPKYGGTESPPGTMAAAAKGEAAPPVSPYEITVPDYTVTRQDGFDHVEIPEGNMLLIEGHPAVPYYRVSLEYPPGYAVQDVMLIERSAPQHATGLNIPLADLGIDDSGKGSKGDERYTGEWWPSKDLVFDYNVEASLDGGSVLTITMYPFYYNSLTTDVEFFKDYTFAIDSVESGMKIALFSTDRKSYAPGDTVKVQLALMGLDAPADTIVEVLVREESTGDTVGGLLLRTLNGVSETAYFSPEWNTQGVPDGTYVLEANIRDSAGNLLQSRRRCVNIGVSAVDIESFTAQPSGSDINISAVCRNAGSVEVSGTAFITVQDQNSAVLAELRYDFSELQPGDTLDFAHTWDAAGVAAGVYRLQAYVRYDSRCSEIESFGIPICVEPGDFARSFGMVRPESSYSHVMDLDMDGDQDGADLAAFKAWSQGFSCRQGN